MEVRKRILEKTHDLFHRHGIRRVTMDDIASQCGISKKTIYLYFRDKNELVDAIAEDYIQQNREHCKIDKEEAENAMHEVFMAMDMVKLMFEKLHPALLHDLEKYHPATFSKFTRHKNNFIHKVVKENLCWGIKEGIYRPDIDIEVITKFRIESMFLPFNLDIFPESKYNLTRIEQDLMEHFVHGLATSKGQRLITKYKNQRTLNPAHA